MKWLSFKNKGTPVTIYDKVYIPTEIDGIQIDRPVSNGTVNKIIMKCDTYCVPENKLWLKMTSDGKYFAVVDNEKIEITKGQFDFLIEEIRR